jgi:hypothetical protein
MLTRLPLPPHAGLAALLLVLAAAAAIFAPIVLALTAPWLLAVLWVVTRAGSALHDSTAPSLADEARRRLSVR